MYYCKLVLYYIQLKSQTFDIVHVQQNLGNFCTKTALPGSKMSQIFHWMKIPLICLVQNIVKQVRKNYWLFYWNCSNTTVIRATNCFNLCGNNIALQVEHNVTRITTRSCNLSSNTSPCCKLPQDVAASRSHLYFLQHFPATCNTVFVAQTLQEQVAIHAMSRLNLKCNKVALQVELKNVARITSPWVISSTTWSKNSICNFQYCNFFTYNMINYGEGL